MQPCPITNGPEKYFAVEFKDELELSSSKKNVSEYMLKKGENCSYATYQW